MHREHRPRSSSRSHRKRKRQDSEYHHRSRKHRSRSISQDSVHERHHKKHREKEHRERDRKIDEIFNWVRENQARRSRSLSQSRYSSRSRSSNYSRDKSRSRSRKEHEISFENSSVRSVVVPVNTQPTTVSDNQTTADQNEQDTLTVRLNALRAEGIPKPITAPPVSEDLSPILNLFLAKSDFAKTMKICDKYPRPENINLGIPELPKDATKIIDQKAVKNDDRFKNDQKCTAALFGLLGKSLDSVLKLRGKIPELVEVGDMLVDGLQLTGFLHQDFTSIRVKGVKQTVNPSYGDVVTQKPEEPEMLLGKTPLGEQMKSCDEINKLKAKFKKPEPQSFTNPRRDFRRAGGEYKKKPFKRDFRPRNRKREDRRTRYFSPKGSYRKGQQDFQRQEENKTHNSKKS